MTFFDKMLAKRQDKKNESSYQKIFTDGFLRQKSIKKVVRKKKIDKFVENFMQKSDGIAKSRSPFSERQAKEKPNPAKKSFKSLGIPNLRQKFLNFKFAKKFLKVFSVSAACAVAAVCAVFFAKTRIVPPQSDAVADSSCEVLAESDASLVGQGGYDSDVPYSLPSPSGEDESRVVYSVYRVKKGDMISEIAERFGISQDTIISVNGIKNSRTIQVGQLLRIPSKPGILYTVKGNAETPQTVAEKFTVSADDVAKTNNAANDAVFPQNATIFVPNALLDWVTRQEINGDLFRRPLRGGYRFTSSFGWRSNPFTGRRTYHNGIDMAIAQGTPIYAALSGKVVSAGWSNVYGKHVIVAHHSGYRTLYGHMSKISVSAGQNVGTGTKLGEVGSTGQSTGPHLHFSVFKYGKALNPRTLWN